MTPVQAATPTGAGPRGGSLVIDAAIARWRERAPRIAAQMQRMLDAAGPEDPPSPDLDTPSTEDSHA